MKYKKSKKILMKNYETQMNFLESSLKSYDKGFEDEAQRLATSLRVLLHDTSSSTSLFRSLEIKKDFLFVASTSRYIPTNEVSYTGLVGMSFVVGGEANYMDQNRYK